MFFLPQLYSSDIIDIDIKTLGKPVLHESLLTELNDVEVNVFSECKIKFLDGSSLYVKTDKPVNPVEYADFISCNYEDTTRYEFCLKFVKRLSGRDYGRLHMSNDSFNHLASHNRPDIAYLGIQIDDAVLTRVDFSYTDSGWIDSFDIIFDNSIRIKVVIDLSKYDVDNPEYTINFFRYLEAIYDCLGDEYQNSVSKIYIELKEMFKYSAKEIVLR